MYILQEELVNKKISLLDKAWQAEETFALLPEKCPVSREWVQEQFLKFPSVLSRNHFILLTSGSSGLPRLVVGSRKRAQELARLLHRAQDSAAAKETVVLLPLSYCYAFINQWLWARMHRRRIRLTAGFAEPEQLRKSLQNSSQSLICLVAAQVRLFAEYFPGASFGRVSRCHFAGGIFPQEKLTQLRRLFPNARIYNNYGCTEAMPRLCLRQAQDAGDGFNLGRPLKNIRLKASSGELFFKSPYGAVGYLEGGDWRQIGRDDWVPTGDLVQPLKDGSWLFQGRRGDVFKRNGEKISLPQIMNSVRLVWPGEAAFYREADAEKEPGYVLVLSPAPRPRQLEEIKRVLRGQYSRAHWPLRIETVKRLPLLPNGKIDTRGLAGKAAPLQETAGKNGVVREKFKKLILETFLLSPAEFNFNLTRARIPAWDSLGMVTLAAGIKKTFALALPPDEAAGFKSLADIISWLAEKGIRIDG